MCQLEGKQEQSPEQIDLYCQGERKRYDIGGKTYIDKEGNVRWSFGKNMHKLVLDDLGYYQWVLKNDFPTELKNKLKKLS
jgi:hypothetical protein